MALFDPTVCHRKRVFLNVYDANKAILWCYVNGAPQLKHYQCPVCGYYHLTSRID